MPERDTGSGANNFGGGDYGLDNDLNVPRRSCQTISIQRSMTGVDDHCATSMS